MEVYETYEELRQSKIKAKLKYQKWYDTLALLFGFLGWIWEYSEYDRYYEQISVWTIRDGQYVIDLLPEREATYMMLLRVCVTLSTLALLLCIYARYKAEWDIRLLKENFKAKMSNPNQSWTAKDVMKWKLFGMMAAEMVYLSVHSVPGVNKNFEIGQQQHFLEYSLDMIMFILMQGRVYLIFRMVKHYSKWMSATAKDICYSQGTPASASFAFKAILKERPAFLVTSSISLLMVLGGLSMRVFERPYMHVSLLNWDNYFNSIWVTYAIITTVGYGDMYPMSHLGRTIGVFTCIAGQFLVSLMVTAIASFTGFSAPQERAYNRIRDALQREQLESLAKNVVVYGYKYYKEVRKAQGKKVPIKFYSQYMRNLLAFKELKRFIDIEEINTPFELLAQKVKSRIEAKKFELVRAMQTNKKLLNKVITMENQMKASETILDYLVYQGTKIHEALENAARDSTVNRPFDGLIANAKALRHFDMLTTLDPPPQLKTIDYDISVLGKPIYPKQILTEQQQMQLYYRIERSINITNPELTKIIKNNKLPTFALREKRILASNPEALNSLKNYIIIRAYSKNPRGHYLSGAQLVDAILAGKYMSLTAGLLAPNEVDEDDETDAAVHETFILDENNTTVGEASSPSRRLNKALSIIKEHNENLETANTNIAEQVINKLKRRVQFKGVSKTSIPSLPEGIGSMKEFSPKLNPIKVPQTILLPNEEMDEIVEEEEVNETNDFYDSMLETDKAEGRVPQWKYEFMNSQPMFTVNTEELLRLPDIQSMPVDQENIWYKPNRMVPKRAVARQKTIIPKQVEPSSQKTLGGEGSQTSVTSLEKFDRANNNIRDPQSGSIPSRKMTGGMDGFNLDDVSTKAGSRNLENPALVNLKPRDVVRGNAFGRVVKDAVQENKLSGYDQMLANLNTPAPTHTGSVVPREITASKRGSHGMSEGYSGLSDIVGAKRGSYGMSEGYSRGDISIYPPDITAGKRGSYGMSEGYSRGDDSSLLEDDIIKEFRQALERSEIHQHQKTGQQNFGYDKRDPYKANTPSVGTGRTTQDYLEDSNFGRTQQYNDSWNTLMRDEIPLARQEIDWRNRGIQTTQGTDDRDARLNNRDRGYGNNQNPSMHWFAHLDIATPNDPSFYYSGRSSLRVSKAELSNKLDRNQLGGQKTNLDLEPPGVKSYHPNPQGPTFWSGY